MKHLVIVIGCLAAFLGSFYYLLSKTPEYRAWKAQRRLKKWRIL